jgi:MGT family glycosyltransferase
MTHFGVLCPELSGHLNPMLALCRELARRGHRITVYQRPVGAPKVAVAGFDCRVYGAGAFPVETSRAQYRRLAELSGLQAFRYTVEIFRKAMAVAMREVPRLVREDKIDWLLADQTCTEGPTVAEVLGLPYVTVCNALVLNREPTVPPFCFSWPYRTDAWGRLRNQAGYGVMRRLAAPVVRTLNQHRRRFRLAQVTTFTDGGSPYAQLSQQPAEFEYPRRQLPPHFHFTGPSADPVVRGAIDFPFEKLTGQPLVYASMGTMQNRLGAIFGCIARACAGLPVQLVISLGGGAKPQALGKLPGRPIVVEFAPQLELIKRAALCITHAGLNTALESLAEGVPMVAIPITNDQPGVAARIKWCGAGEFVTPGRLNPQSLRERVRRVLSDEKYRRNAGRLKDAIARSGGVSRAADVVEGVVGSP